MHKGIFVQVYFWMHFLDHFILNWIELNSGFSTSKAWTRRCRGRDPYTLISISSVFAGRVGVHFLDLWAIRIRDSHSNPDS